ncbi:MAG TPA: hypothetical protein VIL69_13015 [Roseomonas sp.]
MEHATEAAFEPMRSPHIPEPTRHIVPHSGWEEARSRAAQAVDAGARVVAVIGAAGTGKTLLLTELADMLRDRHPGVRLLRTPHHPDRAAAATSEAILLLDEADRASDAELAAFLGAGPRILAGLPPLLHRLEALGHAVAVVQLVPIARPELPGFIAARVTAAGYPADLLTPDAVEELAERSGGVPRLINVLTAAAAFAASLENAPHVTARHVAEAARHAAGAAHTAPRPSASGAPDEAATPKSREPTSSETEIEAATEPAPNVHFPDEAPIAAPQENPPPHRLHLVEAAARRTGAIWLASGTTSAAQAKPESTLAEPSRIEAAPNASARIAPPEAAPAQAAPADPEPEPMSSELVPKPPRPAPVASAGIEDQPPGRADAVRDDHATSFRYGGPAGTGSQDGAVPPRGPAAVNPIPIRVPAQRRRGWVYAGVAVLLLGGAGLAFLRAGDGMQGSVPAFVAPLRAWLAEHTGFGAPAPSAIPSPAPIAAPAVPPAPDPARNPEPTRAPRAGMVASAPQEAAPERNIPAPPAVPDTPQASAPAPFPSPQATLPSAPEPVTTPPLAPPGEESQAISPAPVSPAAPTNMPSAVAEQAPPARPLRIAVYLSAGAARGAGSERLVADLSARFPGVSTRRSSRGPSFPAIRYFFAADAPGAEQIAAMLSDAGITPRIQDFSSYRPQPSPGTIEIWLP